MPQPVKLFCGLLCGDVDLLRRARQLLVRRYGAVDLESSVWDFDQTDYYREESGPDLKRLFVSFETLIQPGRLADIKRETNDLEAELAEAAGRPEVPRPVNIDPGYIDLGKLVLATTKDRSHRIYIGQGIYAEVTLQFTAGRWEPWPWTYPDYRRPEYLVYFMRVRERLREQRREPDTGNSGVANDPDNISNPDAINAAGDPEAPPQRPLETYPIAPDPPWPPHEKYA